MRFIILLILLTYNHLILAHQNLSEHQSTATYLGNEAVLVTAGNVKIVFDPFFHSNFDIYQLVPNEILDAMFNNQAPYDNINAIFISHAHGDHFAADQVLKYLKKFPETKLIAPKQAIEQIQQLPNHESVLPQTTAIELAYKDPAQSLVIENLKIDAIKFDAIKFDVVRIPHSGWPTRRLDVSNLLFRVSLDEHTTVMHMGDADPNDVHFAPYKELFQAKTTQTAFPPYWFFYSTYGPDILNKRINATEAVGVHVPMKVPNELIQTGKPYFSAPGQTRSIPGQKSTQNSTTKN